MMLATGCHYSQIFKAISIMGELVQTPRYESFEVERRILREELLEGLDSQGRMVDLDNILHQVAYGKHPLALPIEGNLANLDGFTLDDIEAHRAEFMVGENCVLAVGGTFSLNQIKDAIEQTFGAMPKGHSTLCEAPMESTAKPVLRYVRDAASQVDIRISFRACPASDPQYPALVLLARLLADGLASRLHAELVDRRGLAYSLAAGLTTYSDCGLFDFEVAVAPNKAAEAVATILDFAADATKWRMRKGEHARTSQRYRYATEYMQDSPADLCSWHGRAALFGVENEFETLGPKMEELGEHDVREAARRVFRAGQMVLVAVGELGRGEWKKIQTVTQNFRQ
jgi:predicted Zn-dependent peptidase